VSSPNKNSAALIPAEIERRIHVVRGQRVTLDFDLAALYGVPTKRLNEQVRRNRQRFPADFSYQLTGAEVRALMSQIATSKPTARGGRQKLPWVFTEQGVAMLSSVLRSPTAVKVNIEIMRAFVRLRRLLATPGELVSQLRQLADTVQLHDQQIRVITEVLRRMAEPPPTPRGRIGFQTPPTPEPSKSSE
jgi:ORF6N domain